VSEAGYRKPWHKALELAGVPMVRFYALRSTIATHLFRAGADAWTVQQAMGHSSLAVTQRYAAAQPLAHTAGLVDRLFGGGGDG
jgi:site-specific recombinase XerD